jgi:aspartate racemase
MKTLGLIGGISWVSTADYYRYINEGINAHLGGLHFARCIIHSFSYADIKDRADSGDMMGVGDMLIAAAINLKNSGANGIVICANTMHMFADAVTEATGLPVVHIADATAKEIVQCGLKTIGLLGTKPTMEKDFYKEKLAAYGIQSVIPDADDRDFVHETIFYELGKGLVTNATKQRYLQIMTDLIARGAEGIILGCTEIPLLINQSDVSIPVFDTTKIHANAAIDFALAE